MNNTFEKVYNDFWNVGLKSLHQFGEHRTIYNDYINESEVTLQNTKPTKRLNDQDKQDQLQKAFSSWYQAGRLEKAAKAMEEYGEESTEYIEYKKRFCGYVKKVASNYLQRYNKYNQETVLEQRFIAGKASEDYSTVEYQIDIERSLNQEEQNILKDKLEGYTSREIASKMNKGKTSIERRMNNIRSKLS